MSIQESTPEPSFLNLLEGLFYPSESDEPIEYVEYNLNFDPPLSIGQLRDLALITPDVYVEEIPEDEFWQPVTRNEDWFEDDEKQRTDRFIALQQQLESWLSNRQVFRAGQIEVYLYLLGRKADGNWAGLKTLVIET